MDLGREIDRRIDEYVDLTRQIETGHRPTPGRPVPGYPYLAVYQRLANGSRSAQAMGFDVKWVWKLHGRPLAKFKLTMESD